MNLTIIDWIIMLVYFAFVLGNGFVLQRRVETSTEFFLAGPAIPAWICGLAFSDADTLTIAYYIHKIATEFIGTWDSSPGGQSKIAGAYSGLWVIDSHTGGEQRRVAAVSGDPDLGDWFVSAVSPPA